MALGARHRSSRLDLRSKRGGSSPTIVSKRRVEWQQLGIGAQLAGLNSSEGYKLDLY